MRSALVSVVLAVLVALAQLGGVAAAGEELLVPDLRPRRPSQLQVVKEDGMKLLEFTTDVLNKGRAPLELRPQEADCDGNGDPDDDRLAFQQLFVDDGSGVFERDADTAQERPAGCQHFHPEHDHWHFDDFGVYKLFAYRSDGRLKRPAVARADKVSFCMVDTYSFRPELPGWSSQLYYPKRAEGETTSDCGQETITGVSIGWVDRYPHSVAGQELPIKGLRRGLYCLHVRTDPSDLLMEMNEKNNVNAIRVRLIKDPEPPRTSVVIPKKARCS